MVLALHGGSPVVTAGQVASWPPDLRRVPRHLEHRRTSRRRNRNPPKHRRTDRYDAAGPIESFASRSRAFSALRGSQSTS
jgi:hypothetical protein